MIRVLAAASAVLMVCAAAPAQKKKTFLGDSWKGEVVSADEGTREITIKFEEGSRTETFTGVLPESYKVKQGDGSPRELKISEIRPGARVRVFAKTEERRTAAGTVKFNRISAIHFLGKDELTKVREALNIPPSVAVAPGAAGGLPAANPLKVYLASEPERTRDTILLWAGKWNRGQAAKHGAVEFVTNFAQADVSLIVFDGDEDALLPPVVMHYNERPFTYRPLTVLLVGRKGDGLGVLWRQTLLGVEGGGPAPDKSRVTAELEKLLKARSKK